MVPYKDVDTERDPPPSAISPVDLVDLEEPEPMTFASRRIETIREHPERPQSPFDEDDGDIPPHPMGPPPTELV